MKIKNLFRFSERGSAEKRNPDASSPAPAEWQWRSHGISVVGHRRKINEDAFLERPESGLWMVADGMGGHQAGDVASRTLAEALGAVEDSDDLDTLAQRVAQGIKDVNAHLHRLASESTEGQIIGSTVVALVARGLSCAAIWAGDSRLYRYRAGQLEQLTCDHSLMDELVRAGLMSAEEALLEGGANIITRAVGAESQLNLDSFRFEAEAGDLYLLCSDGLAKELEPNEIAAFLESKDLPGSAQDLIDAALARGGRDNITVLLAKPDQPGKA
jgi:type VI secretion system protein ImpM